MIDLQEDRGGTIVKVCIFSTALTSIVVPLRFFVRASVVKSVGWDDWTILAAAVSIWQLVLLFTKSVFINSLIGSCCCSKCSYDPECEIWCRSPYEGHFGR